MIPNELKKIIRRVVPRPRLMLRKICYFPVDTVDRLLGRRDELTPPRSLQIIGGECFEEIGQAFFGYFLRLCGLQPSEKVLEVGCGVGRMAVPLTRYLDSGGSYEGFDVAVDEVRWCQKNISTRYPRFHFHVSDVFNGT
ncbi:MAG: class I SAM-dependent methyltransferase, partial [Terriglobia bacterium]